MNRTVVLSVMAALVLSLSALVLVVTFSGKVAVPLLTMLSRNPWLGSVLPLVVVVPLVYLVITKRNGGDGFPDRMRRRRLVRWLE